jgi:hypothetical protein
MKNKVTYAIAFVAVILAFVQIAQAEVDASVGNESSVVAPSLTVSTGDESTVAPSGVVADSNDSAIAPTSNTSNGDETGAIAPSNPTSNGNETGGIVATGSTSNGNETGGIVPTSSASNGDESGATSGAADTDGGSTSASLVASVGGSASNGPGVSFSASSNCPLITDALVSGGNNDKVQVAKLQAFLKNHEGANVTVNGIFDAQTLAAVKAFQIKYLSDVLGPWNSTRATGMVYITTAKKINELACKSPIVLSADEQAVIKAFIAKNADQTNSDIVSTDTTPATSTGVVAQEASVSNSDNTATVANASIFARFWNFIVNLFR